MWNDPAQAQELLKQLSQLKEKLAPFRAVQARVDDLEAMCELLSEEGVEDAETLAEQDREADALKRELDQLELETLLAGEHDSADAIVEIKAGAGGTDACDWVTMLQRMYLKWAELHGFAVDILEESEADIAGLTNTTFIIHGKNTYGYMKAERGVHRLVRISPFDAAKRRQTSFAKVDVLPDIGEEIKVDINPDDLEIDYYRASGAGGQHVNKTDSAVRITHMPTWSCRDVPERALAAQEQSVRHVRAASAFAGTRTARKRRENERHARRIQSQRMGQSGPLVCVSAVYNGKRPPHGTGDRRRHRRDERQH